MEGSPLGENSLGEKSGTELGSSTGLSDVTVERSKKSASEKVGMAEVPLAIGTDAVVVAASQW